jgi:hypothetical protein
MSLVRFSVPRSCARNEREQRQQHGGQRGAGQPAARSQATGRPRQPAAALADFLMGDQVHVDRAGELGGGDADSGGEQLSQPTSPGGAEDQLGSVVRPGEVQQRPGHVVADDLVVPAAEAFHQGPLPGQVRRVGAGQPVGPADVHGEQVSAGVPGGDPGRPADQRVALRPAGHRDHDPLRGLPGGRDPMLVAVPVQLLVHLLSHPQQGQLAQRGEVADPELVPQRRVDLVRGVDVAVRHPPAQRLRVMSTSSTCSAVRTTWSGTVSRCGTPVIVWTTSLSDSRCWMLTVDSTVMPAASRSSMSCQRLA